MLKKWTSKIFGKSEKSEDKDCTPKCFICGIPSVEYITDLSSYFTERSIRTVTNYYKQTTKVNHLLSCPNCGRYYCVKHENMIIREHGKCNKCQNAG